MKAGMVRVTDSPKPEFCDLVINVLGYREGKEWVALALEMDLRGYGKTFEAAFAELFDCICMQIGFAQYKDQTDMVFHPAAPEYFQIFAQIRADLMLSLGRTQTTDNEYQVKGMPIPPPHVIEECKRKFSLVDG